MAYEEYDYYNEPAGDSKSLKESLREILNGLQDRNKLREAGISLKEALQLTPNVTESLGRGGVAQAIGTSGDLRDLSNTINSYLPKSVRNFTRAAEFLANPYATAIQQTAPTTEETLDFVPRATAPYEGYKQHETLGEFVAPSLGYFGGKAAKAYGNYVGPTAYKALEDYMVKTGGIQPITTWHGSKNSFDEFDPKRIASASGIDYGYGLYSAEHPEIAKGFGQNLYKLDIPDEHIPKMIDWYSNEQSPEVTKILKEAGLPYKANGEAITMAAAEKMGGSDETKSGFQKAAEYLHSLGIKGNKYENFQIKKGQGAETNNYVLYDPTDAKILEKNGQKLASDIDELGFHSPLENAILKIQQPKGTGDQFLKQLEKTPGVKTEELDVTGVKQYLLDHPNVTKQELLDYVNSNRLKLENKFLNAETGQGNTYDEYRLEGGAVYHDDDYISSLADDLHYDMKNDDVIRSQEREALLEADPERYADYDTNPYAQARLEEDIDGVLYENAKTQAEAMYYDDPIRHYYDEHGYDIYGNDNMGYSVKDPQGRYVTNIEDRYDIGDVEDALRQHLLDEGVIDIGSEGGPKYEDYTLPGKYTNYREVLTTLPQNIDKSIIGSKKYQDALKNVTTNGSNNELGDMLRQAERNNYESGHFDEPNILAHTRLNDRIINGKKTLMVEEIQSDWHQAGRKKGYASEAKPLKEDYENKLEDWRNFIREEATKMNLNVASLDKLSESTLDSFATNEMYHLMDQPTIDRMNEIFAAKNEAWRKFKNKLSTNVPDAPFKKNWHELMMKQILNEAVKGDYDAVAFTTGKQQAERYNLSKQVDQINWMPYESNGSTKVVRIQPKNGNTIELRLNPEGAIMNGGQFADKTIDEVIGKDIAKKIMDENTGDLSGVNLDIGGEGMKGFYDKILPDFINKYGKKYGIAVKKEHLTPPDNDRFMNFKDWAIQKDPSLNDTFLKHSWNNKDDLYKEFINTDRRGDEVHFFDLSDMAKKDIKSKGQPLFSGIGLAAPALMPEDQDKTKK